MGLRFQILGDLRILDASGDKAPVPQPRDREFLRLLLWRWPESQVTAKELAFLVKDPSQCVHRLRRILNRAHGLPDEDKSVLQTVQTPLGETAYRVHLFPDDRLDWQQAKEHARLADAQLLASDYPRALEEASQALSLLSSDPSLSFNKAIEAELVTYDELSFHESLRDGAQVVKAMARVKTGDACSREVVSDLEAVLAKEPATVVESDDFWECYAMAKMCREGVTAANAVGERQKKLLGYMTSQLESLLEQFEASPEEWRRRLAQQPASKDHRESSPASTQAASIHKPTLLHSPIEGHELSADQLALACAICLYCHQYDDGGWGRSLWRSGGYRYSEDVHPKSPVEHRRALTVTGWAAHALLSRLPDPHIRTVAQRAYDYCVKFFDDSQPAFGSIHRPASVMPGVVNDAEIVANPRHTGSALRLLHTLNGNSRQVARCVVALLELRKGSAWAESPFGQGNTLATAYVLDMLMKAEDNLGALARALPASEADYLRTQLPPAIADGLDWLAQRQASDGLWGYRDFDPFPELRPSYTAQVIACVPQLFDRSPASLSRLATFCASIVRSGGVPQIADGRASLASTAMVMFGLRRVEASTPALVQCAEVCSNFLQSEYLPLCTLESDVMAALFGFLAFSPHLRDDQLRTEALNLIQALEALRPFGDNPSEEKIAAVTEELSRRGFDWLTPPIRAILSDHPAA